MALPLKIPTPQELGFPEHFDQWRPPQVEALRWLLGVTTRIKAMAAPTGFGKSAVYVAYAKMTGLPTAFITDSRALQDQLMATFSGMGMVDLRGRRNYACGMRNDYTCEEGYQGSCVYKGTVMCPSSQAEMRAATSWLVVTNYDKWTSAKKYGTGMSHFQQVVFDEGHEAPNALARAMQVTLGHKERESYLLVDPPTDFGNMDAWKEWSQDARELAEALYKQASDRIRGVSNAPTHHVRHFLHMKNLLRRMSILSLAKASDWVVEEQEKGFQFDPVRPGRYAESSLLMRIPSIVVVSATLREKTMFLMGVPREQFTFREFDTDFPAERNPIYWVPTMRVDSRAVDLSKLWIRLDQVLARRRDRKGIVHTVSYARREDILARSRFAASMLLNQRGEAPTPLIDEFRAAGPGAILVSPSVGQGYDFPGSDCEFQFLCKIPFPPPSLVLKARTAADPDYPYYLAAQKMTQVFGRGMRSKEDRCVSPDTLILTDDLRWVPAGDLTVGQRLLAFSEFGDGCNVGGSRRNPRRWQWSHVEAKMTELSPRVRIRHERGSLVCTPTHPVLVSHKTHRTAVWIEAQDLKPHDRLIYVLDPWSGPLSYIDGWLAGITDGEGHLTTRHKGRNPNVTSITLSQNQGVVLDQMENFLTMSGFDYVRSDRVDCRKLTLKGGFPEILTFLGCIRPSRLLRKFTGDSRGEIVRAVAYPKVVRISRLSAGPIVRLRTSTRTYVSAGLASHNCENFIADDHIEWFLNRYRYLFPRSFSWFFRRADVLPQPPPPLAQEG